MKIIKHSFFINVVDNWVYYCNASNNKLLLYKIHTDGTGNKKLSNDELLGNAPLINVIGNWIYYVADNSKLYKVHTDGTERQLVE